MSCIKVNLEQARDRRVYFSPAIKDAKIPPRKELVPDWYTDEACKNKTQVVLPEVGLYKIHVFLIRASDKSNNTDIYLLAPYCEVEGEVQKEWKHPLTKLIFSCFCAQGLNPPQIKFGIINRSATIVETFRCEKMIMITTMIV